ncbi:phage protease [Magnetococcus sp. PR-3]|uniref:phage protease n=1 Tax=Magnetococcus sp. PR-3 TaxID=3120355 RepID=UPI002FCE3477
MSGMTVHHALLSRIEDSTDDKWIHILPAGRFRASHGDPRPKKPKEGWLLEAEHAAELIAQFEALNRDLVIDYEHQTYKGSAAPAAGWITKLEWREGSGLWGQVKWTERARALIKADEYRYLSPVFIAHETTGVVERLFNAGLTNNPALDRLEPVAAEQQTEEVESMDKLLASLGLKPGTTEEEALAHVGQAKLAACAALGLNAETATLTDATAKMVALSTQATNPDPTKYVALSVMQSAQQELQGQVAALTQELGDLKTADSKAKVVQLVAEGQKAGKLTKAQETWALELGGSNLTALESYLKTTPANPALGGQQQTGSDGVPSDADSSSVALTAVHKDAAKQLGLSEEAYAKNLNVKGDQ